MTPLHDYLDTTFKDDCTFRDRLLRAAADTIPLFTYKEEPSDSIEKIWSYSIRQDTSIEKTSKFSFSTHAMIQFALEVYISQSWGKYSSLLGPGYRSMTPLLSPRDQTNLINVINKARQMLIKSIIESDRTNKPFNSGTYGDNDPFTLCWMVELIFNDSFGNDRKELSQCRKKIKEAGLIALNRKSNVLEITDKDYNEVPCSFLDVRQLHLQKALENLADVKKEKVWQKRESKQWEKFNATVHRQLSYSAMKAPKFDPAELAFAFEGSLILHPLWMDDSTVEQVCNALAIEKYHGPIWRPLSPFLACRRGHGLFLISIEVANSILRSCKILDSRNGSNFLDGRDTSMHFSRFESNLRIYANWLLGEVNEVAKDDRSLNGWRTDYENSRETIQLWHTSHVLLFLNHYASYLTRKIATDAAKAASLSLRKPKKISGYWDGDALPTLYTTENETLSPLKQIKEKYVEKRLSSSGTALCSMLLYGPPGTGKTKLAEQIAAELDQPLITVTVSDFLAEGSAEIETRAQGIFKVLHAQRDVIVLFDEIDQFLLDRNSSYYREQGDVFKFMTPGMLTKFQDLRDAKNCIFILATNYYERIDSAIKRRGRIDEHFHLSLPDTKHRVKLLAKFTKDFLNNIENIDHFDDQTRADVSEINIDANKLQNAIAETKMSLLEDTVFFGWGDLKNLVESKMDVLKIKDYDSLAKELSEKARLIEAPVTFKSYRHRFFEGTGERPYNEFLYLLYLLMDAKVPLRNHMNDMADNPQTIITLISGLNAEIKKDVNQWGTKVAEELKEWISKCLI